MECYDSFIVDLDGVLWRGSRPISSNIEPLSRLARTGASIVFLTNNSTRSRRMYARKIGALLGVPVRPEQVVNSGYSAAEWLREHHGCSRVLPIGEEGLAEELLGACHELVRAEDWREADAVVVGLDRNVTYTKLAGAHKAIMSGALFIATNTDKSFPVEDGTEPGAGALVGLLRESTGLEPAADAGKPGQWILSLALRAIGPKKPLIVGDRIDTDMEMARRSGLPGLLVLTGITGKPPAGAWFYSAQSLSSLRVENGRICIENL